MIESRIPTDARTVDSTAPTCSRSAASRAVSGIRVALAAIADRADHYRLTRWLNERGFRAVCEEFVDGSAFARCRRSAVVIEDQPTAGSEPGVDEAKTVEHRFIQVDIYVREGDLGSF